MQNLYSNFVGIQPIHEQGCTQLLGKDGPDTINKVMAMQLQLDPVDLVEIDGRA